MAVEDEFLGVVPATSELIAIGVAGMSLGDWQPTKTQPSAQRMGNRR